MISLIAELSRHGLELYRKTNAPTSVLAAKLVQKRVRRSPTVKVT